MRTDPPTEDLRRLRRARAGRRAFVVILAVFLGLGALGTYGVRTVDRRASGGGYELTVHYARVSRPGLATPWSVDVRHPGGFPGPTLTLATTASYFDIFDENSVDPEPTESVSDGERIIWTVQTPEDSDTLTVSLDARIEPAVQLKSARATTSVLVDGSAVASVGYRSFVMP